MMLSLEVAERLREAADVPPPYQSAIEYFQDELLSLRLRLASEVNAGGEPTQIETECGSFSTETAGERMQALISARLDRTHPSPLGSLLPKGARLSDTERSVLSLTVGMDLDPRTAAAVEAVWGPRQGPGIELGLLLRLFAPTLGARLEFMRSVVGASSVLRRCRLIQLVGDSLEDDKSRVRASRAVFAAMAGSPVPDPCIESVTRVRNPPSSPSSMVGHTTDAGIESIVWRYYPGGSEAASRCTYWPVILLHGAPGTGKSSLVHRVAARIGYQVREVLCDRVAGSRHQAELLGRLVEGAESGREILLFEKASLIGGRDSAGRHELRRLLTDRTVPMFLEAESLAALDPLLLGSVDLVLRVDPLRAEGRKQILDTLLPAGLGDDSERELLALRHEVNGWALTKAVHLARLSAEQRDSQSPQMSTEDVAEAVALQLHGDLSQFAERRAPCLSMEDLVLNDETRGELSELIDACQVHTQVLSRWGFGKHLTKGRGLCLLFHGEPGTGKTHCAEVLAAQLKQDLYQISLPKIVSKWVGETERNIERIFVAARQSRAVLLFDEADSLFANRTRVESANDRYANMETNYLLQQIEHYDGIVILTTNFIKNLDAAMERRIAYRIEFSMPEEEERELIWRVMVPPEAPLSPEVDFSRLGTHFRLSGGHIKNAVLRAAYRAMAQGCKLSMDILCEAAEAECRQAGKLV